ncbi:Txe/YoeB family addiction module toxin [Fusobacterium sp.]|uniref:Txe/YoeB family addiction module toxin n=1 Tax=Fusobacterium sp. TaxID=68766 RepID=UPI002A817436|nr:Txe/YoeB family addiction module toxin [Fusobacterium sp.]
MKISFSIQAWKEYLYFQTQDKKTLKKINELIKDIERNGALNGIGKPEKLTNNLSGLYSKRINDKDRLVYENDFIVILETVKFFL